MPQIKIQPENAPKWGSRLSATTFASGSLYEEKLSLQP
jgi:hypothetical protein